MMNKLTRISQQEKSHDDCNIDVSYYQLNVFVFANHLDKTALLVQVLKHTDDILSWKMLTLHNREGYFLGREFSQSHDSIHWSYSNSYWSLVNCCRIFMTHPQKNVCLFP